MGCNYSNHCGCTHWDSDMVSGEDAWASFFQAVGRKCCFSSESPGTMHAELDALLQ